jgi:hypothetical protein
VDGQRRRLRNGLDGGAEADLFQNGGVDAAGQVTQFLERLPQFAAGLFHDGLDGGVSCGGAGPADRRGQGEEVLLSAVVQITFDLPALRDAGLDDAGP